MAGMDVGDLIAVVCDSEGTRDMNRIGLRAVEIIEEVAAEWRLPLETGKGGDRVCPSTATGRLG